MKLSHIAAAVILIFPATQALAAPDDVEISVSRTKLDQQKERGSSRTVKSKEYAYKVKVTNDTFDDMPSVQVKYRIFFEDSGTMGSSEGATDKAQKGSETLTNLLAHKSLTFTTKSVTLTTASLNAGWYIPGASGQNARKAEDEISGLWIRAYVGDEMVGEYFNPSNIPDKNDWKE